ncbi:MAG TPA: hypothetical protein VHS09_04550 [Polyangiaceae bacterium]|nr:hypothetical protein [Polyangiaceae bacterium]
MTSPYLVFSSSTDPRVDVTHWDVQAGRFFATHLDLVGRTADGEARIFVTPPRGEAGGERPVSTRPRAHADLAMAEEAERRAGGGGLALLARRCHTVWLVGRTDDDDRLALRLAMILASVVLGPVLDARGPELFGVKTAREKLGG